MCSRRLLSSDVVDVRSRDSQPAVLGGDAAGAGAVFLDGGVVVGVSRVPEIESARGCDGVSEALSVDMVLLSCELYSCLFFLLEGGWWFDGNRGEMGRLTAVRVGQTQSNISAPRAMDTTRSSG